MDEIKWLEVAVNTTPDRLDEVTAKLTAGGMTGWSSRMRGVPAVSGAEPAVLGLCGPGAAGPDAGASPG